MIRVLPLVALLIVAACSRNAPASAETQSADATQAGAAADQATPVKPVPATLPDIIARVNGEDISRADFELAVQEIEMRAGEPVPADQRDQVLRGVLDELVAYRLLVQETRARNTTVPDAEVDARVAAIRQQFPTAEAFQQVLQQRNMTEARLRSDIREDMLVAAMIEAQLGPVAAVTPAQMDEFYAQNPDQFRQAERVRASHILIQFPPNADAAAREQARARAAELLKEAQAGKDFAGLAKQYSQDGSAAQGGDLGFFERGQMVPPFENAAFALQPGQTSEVVESQFGYHVIRVTEKQNARVIPLDEVRPQLEQFLQQRTRQEQTQAFVDQLKAKGKIEIFV
jgi:peptidyl-prolyl cis-trans isomerase C